MKDEYMFHVLISLTSNGELMFAPDSKHLLPSTIDERSWSTIPKFVTFIDWRLGTLWILHCIAKRWGIRNAFELAKPLFDVVSDMQDKAKELGIK